MIISEYKRKDYKNQETATLKFGNIKFSHLPGIIDYSKRFKDCMQDLEKIRARTRWQKRRMWSLSPPTNT